VEVQIVVHEVDTRLHPGVVCRRIMLLVGKLFSDDSQLLEMFVNVMVPFRLEVAHLELSHHTEFP